MRERRRRLHGPRSSRALPTLILVLLGFSSSGSGSIGIAPSEPTGRATCSDRRAARERSARPSSSGHRAARRTEPRPCLVPKDAFRSAVRRTDRRRPEATLGWSVRHRPRDARPCPPRAEAAGVRRTHRLHVVMSGRTSGGGARSGDCAGARRGRMRRSRRLEIDGPHPLLRDAARRERLGARHRGWGGMPAAGRGGPAGAGGFDEVPCTSEFVNSGPSFGFESS